MTEPKFPEGVDNAIFSLGPGQYIAKTTDEGLQIKKVHGNGWTMPVHSLFEKVLYLFTGRLKGVKVINQEVKREKV